MDQQIIRALNLRKSYGQGAAKTEVLKGLKIDIERAYLTAIVGRSGSGKSTLLHILAGLESADKPEAGSPQPSLLINGCELLSLDAEELAAFRLRNIGLVFQFFNFLPTLSLLENVALPLYLAETAKTLARRKSRELLELVGIEKLSERRPHEISGGELQRAAIARALANDPPLIFADEPTGNLDRKNAEIVLNLFRRLVDEQKRSIVIVTHDPLVEEAAEKVLRMADGLMLP